MKREDFGFVMSRVMAVWLIAGLPGNFVFIANAIQEMAGNLDANMKRMLQHLLVEQVALSAAYIGLATLLWTKAAWFCPARLDPPVVSARLDSLALKSALLSAIGVYFVARGVMSFANAWLEGYPLNVFLRHGVSSRHDWREVVLEILVGVAIYIWANHMDRVKLLVGSRGDSSA